MNYEVQIAIETPMYNRNVSGTKLISLLTSAAYTQKSITSKTVLLFTIFIEYFGPKSKSEYIEL